MSETKPEGIQPENSDPEAIGKRVLTLESEVHGLKRLLAMSGMGAFDRLADDAEIHVGGRLGFRQGHASFVGERGPETFRPNPRYEHDSGMRDLGVLISRENMQRILAMLEEVRKSILDGDAFRAKRILASVTDRLSGKETRRRIEGTFSIDGGYSR